MTHPTQSKRARELRRAWRTFWWMVVRPKPGDTLGRRAWLGIAFHEARCGLLTGGEHSWGPLHYKYEGARWRKQDCRWCGSTLTPAEEMDRNPPPAAEAAKYLATEPPSDEDMARAIAIAERRGLLRDGKWLWD